MLLETHTYLKLIICQSPMARTWSNIDQQKIFWSTLIEANKSSQYKHEEKMAS
jgi:hypothetical protein